MGIDSNGISIDRESPIIGSIRADRDRAGECGRALRQLINSFRLRFGNRDRIGRFSFDQRKIVDQSGRFCGPSGNIEVDAAAFISGNYGSGCDHQRTGMFSAAGDIQIATVIDRGAVSCASIGDNQIASGIDRGAVSCASIGDNQIAVGIDRGAVRGAAAEDMQMATVIDRGVVRQTTVLDTHISAGIDRCGVYGAAAVDSQMATVIDRGFICGATVIDIQMTSIDRGTVCHAAAEDSQMATVIERSGNSRGAGMHCCRTITELQPAECVGSEGDICSIVPKNISSVFNDFSCSAAADDIQIAVGIDCDAVRRTPTGDIH